MPLIRVTLRALILGVLLSLFGVVIASAQEPCQGQQEQTLVACIKNVLDVQGQQWLTNEDAFEITRRAACLSPGAQLVGKTPAQNGAWYKGRKYSHDVIALGSDWRDILKDAGPPLNLNTPVWYVTGTSNAPLFAPVDCDHMWPAPLPVPPPAPISDPIQLQIDALADRVGVLERQVHYLGAAADALSTDTQLLKARPIWADCRASIFGIPVACTLIKEGQ